METRLSPFKSLVNNYRVFDPLLYAKSNTDCVFHVCTYWGEVNHGDGNKDPENTTLKDVQRMVKSFDINPSDKKIRVDVVISVNGDCGDKEGIQFLRSIDKTIINECFHITIFQRPNTGYQWGAFYDVWLKYKDIECPVYITIEQDYWFAKMFWYDYIMSEIKDYGFLGKYGKRINMIDPTIYNPVIWRDGSNKIKTDITQKDTAHTDGAYHICSKKLLEKLDKTYGCFTFSIGSNHNFDGILLGEVGFSQKTKAVGLNWKGIQDFHDCYDKTRW